MKTFLKSNKTTFRHPCSHFLTGRSTTFNFFFFYNCRQIQRLNPITFSILTSKCNCVSAYEMKSARVSSIYQTSKYFQTLHFFLLFSGYTVCSRYLPWRRVRRHKNTTQSNKENGHKHLEHRSNTGDKWPDTAALAQQHFMRTGKHEGFGKRREISRVSRHLKRDLMIYHKTPISSITAERMVCLTSTCLWANWNKVSRVMIIIAPWFHTERYCQTLGE